MKNVISITFLFIGLIIKNAGNIHRTL